MPSHDMRRSLWNALALIALCALLAGCAGLYLDRRETISLTGGDAVAANKVAQMIDPWPAAAADPNIAFNGERMGRAIERYRTGRTAPLQTTSTSSVKFEPVLLGGAAPAAPAGTP